MATQAEVAAVGMLMGATLGFRLVPDHPAWDEVAKFYQTSGTKESRRAAVAAVRRLMRSATGDFQLKALSFIENHMVCNYKKL